MGIFFVIRPNPILHFGPFLSTHFFPCLNPIFKNASFCAVLKRVVQHTFEGKSNQKNLCFVVKTLPGLGFWGF